MGVNHLADKTDLELKALRGRRYSGVYNGGGPFPYKHIDRAQLPTDYDWRLYGAVTPVKGTNSKILIKQIFVIRINLYLAFCTL